MSHLQALLDHLDLADPHEFATAYVNHVAVNGPLSVALAAQRWTEEGHTCE